MRYHVFSVECRQAGTRFVKLREAPASWASFSQLSELRRIIESPRTGGRNLGIQFRDVPRGSQRFLGTFYRNVLGMIPLPDTVLDVVQDTVSGTNENGWTVPQALVNADESDTNGRW